MRTSFGSRIALRTKSISFSKAEDENGEYYDYNMLIYVALHELSHVLCDEIGHTPKFHRIFEKILKQAELLKIYNPNIPIVKNYCGHH